MHNRIPSRSRAEDAKAQGRQGKTLPAQGPAQEPVPRMPHERDESADSQPGNEPSAQRTGQIAHDDMERGLVDTDKGPALDEAYDKVVGGDKERKKKFSP